MGILDVAGFKLKEKIMQTENTNETYNFDQAMEGVAHGLFVARLCESICHTILDPLQGVVEIKLDDFYAKDWVDVSDLVKSD